MTVPTLQVFMFVHLLAGDVNRLQASAAFFEIGQQRCRAGNMTKPEEENFSKRYAAIFATVVIWSTPSLFQFYLIRYYDPWAQNFYRYIVACLAIAPFVFYHLRREGPRIDIRAIGLCFIPCLPNVIHQITQVIALFYMGLGVYSIFIRSSLIFTAMLA